MYDNANNFKRLVFMRLGDEVCASRFPTSRSIGRTLNDTPQRRPGALHAFHVQLDAMTAARRQTGAVPVPGAGVKQVWGGPTRSARAKPGTNGQSNSHA